MILGFDLSNGLNIFAHCIIFFARYLITLEANQLFHETNQLESFKIQRFPCDNVTPRIQYGQRGSFWVLYNYFKPTRQFSCHETLTYTTHSDFRYLDNLVPLLERWQGPISLAIYAPGSDFEEAMLRIQFLRQCHPYSEKVKEFVNFHLFFNFDHMPLTRVPSDPSSVPLNCSKMSVSTAKAMSLGLNVSTYKKMKNLTYPINVARNVAREMATTHYVLPSDIELYPSPNLIPEFLKMIQRNSKKLELSNPKVFVLPIFELDGNVTTLPADKTELVQMLRNTSAISFHKFICARCLQIPKPKAWVKNVTKGKGDLNVFHVVKRHSPQWEPIYIGTKSEPTYDERLNWEGRNDKMIQAYKLCVLNYDFHILDNAFLVHRPGIKTMEDRPRNRLEVLKRQRIFKTILSEVEQLYGSRNGCAYT